MDLYIWPHFHEIMVKGNPYEFLDNLLFKFILFENISYFYEMEGTGGGLSGCAQNTFFAKNFKTCFFLQIFSLKYYFFFHNFLIFAEELSNVLVTSNLKTYFVANVHLEVRSYGPVLQTKTKYLELGARGLNGSATLHFYLDRKL